MSSVVLPLAAGIGVALGVVLQPIAANAQNPDAVRACDRHAEIAGRLDEQYKEVPTGFGIQLNGNLLQLFVSKETGTWTLLSTTPSGMSCIVGAGESWEALPVPNNDPYA
jgi:hypothetical protein